MYLEYLTAKIVCQTFKMFQHNYTIPIILKFLIRLFWCFLQAIFPLLWLKITLELHPSLLTADIGDNHSEKVSSL